MENLLKRSFKEDRINKIELQEKKKKKKIELKTIMNILILLKM